MLAQIQIANFPPTFAGGSELSGALTSCGIVPKAPAIVSISVLPLIFGLIILVAAGGVIAFWLLKRIRAHGQEDNEDAIKQTEGGSRRTIDEPDFHPVELYLGTSENTPAVKFSAVKAGDLPHNKHPLDPSSTKLSGMSGLLQLVPSVLSAAEFGTGNYMRVVVNGPLVVASDAHSFLPFVRGADGKVIELAKLQDCGRICQVLNTAMVWQFASVIVAQKHLADISKKLDEIKRGVEDILTFLETERAAKITGALKYLEQAIQAVTQGEFPEALRYQLESVERDLISVQVHLGRELRERTDEIAKIGHDEWFGTRDFTQKIENHQDRMYEVQQQWVLCVRARAANWQVLSAFPGEERLKIIRNHAILESIDEGTALHRLMNEKMRRKVGQVDSVFNRVETLEERKRSLEQRFRKNFDTIAFSACEISRQVKQIADEQLLLSRKPMVLALKVAQGRVLEAYELDER